MLGEPPQKAIRRFAKEGMIRRAGVAQRLARQYRVSDLKLMLKQRVLSVSGRKQDLIARLVKADAKGMEAVVSDVPIFQCSNEGQRVAQ